MKVSAELVTTAGLWYQKHVFFFASLVCASLLTIGASPIPVQGDHQSSEKVRLCGHKLKNEIMAMCRGRLPGSLSLGSPVNGPRNINNSSFLMKPVIRVTRGVIEECCRKPCDPRALFKYCSHPARPADSRLSQQPQPTTTTTAPPTKLLHRSPRTEKHQQSFHPQNTFSSIPRISIRQRYNTRFGFSLVLLPSLQMEPYTLRSNLLLVPRNSEGENPSATFMRPGLFFSSSRDSFFTLSDSSSGIGSSTTRGYQSLLSNGKHQQQQHYRLGPSVMFPSSSSSSPHFSVEKYYPNGIRAGDEEESVDTTNGYSIDDSPQVTSRNLDRELDNRFRYPSESRSVTDSDFGEVFAIPAGTHGELY